MSVKFEGAECHNLVFRGQPVLGRGMCFEYHVADAFQMVEDRSEDVIDGFGGGCP